MKYLPTAPAVLVALAVSACQVAPPPAPQPLPLPTLLAGVRGENHDLEAIFASGGAAAQSLGALNGKLQSVGYFRRVPSQPATEVLQASLRRVAAQKGLIVKSFDASPPAEVPPPPPQKLQAGQRWQPSLDAFRGVLSARLDLSGRPTDIAAFIDALPEQVDRLLVVTNRQAFSNGAILTIEMYYEKQLPAPEVELRWPTLAERLKAAGYRPDDPALAKLPEYAALREQVELGQRRLPDVRRVLQISADFPRWQLRWQFFDERSRAELAVHGAQVMGLP